MAFVVQCPFCKLRAKVPDRANGAIGRCPKCASSFTLASADDQHLPECAVASADAVDEPDIQSVAASAVGIAIAEAAASVEESTPADSLTVDNPHRSASSAFQPAVAAGALALLFSGIALIGGSIPMLCGFVLSLSGLALLTGMIAIILASLSARPRLILPIAGSVAAVAMLIVAWLFPALLGPAYEYTRQRRDPPPVGLRAVPLAGALALDETPEWVDAKRYALQRDDLRVHVIRVALLPPTAKEPTERLLVRVRVSLDRADAKSLERNQNLSPRLTDDMGKLCALRRSEFFDLGGGRNKPGLFPVPTIEETFVFKAPAEGWKSLRLELPAARWRGTGVFQFAIPATTPGPAPDAPIPQPKSGK